MTYITIYTIKRIVCSYNDIRHDELSLKTRKREIVYARQLCHYFAKKYTKHSLVYIGEQFGNKHHATVLHSVRTINNLSDVNRSVAEDVKEIDDLLISNKETTYDSLLEKRDRLVGELKDLNVLIEEYESANEYVLGTA